MKLLTGVILSTCVILFTCVKLCVCVYFCNRYYCVILLTYVTLLKLCDIIYLKDTSKFCLACCHHLSVCPKICILIKVTKTNAMWSVWPVDHCRKKISFLEWNLCELSEIIIILCDKWLAVLIILCDNFSNVMTFLIGA